MRISFKIFLSHLLVIALMGGALGATVPGMANRYVERYARQTVVDQAKTLARLVEEQGADRLPRLASIVTGRERLVFLFDGEGNSLQPRAIEAVRAIPRDLIKKVSQSGQARALVIPRTTVARVFRENQSEGARVVMAAAPFKEGEKARVLVVFRPISLPTKPNEQIGDLIWLLILGASGGAVLISSMVSWAMVRRLRRMGGLASEYAEGRFGKRLPEGGADEIAQLGRSLNYMADRIEALVEGLKKSEGLRREFLATVSHELRTPITSIRGFAEALRDKVVSDEAQKQRYLDIIAGEAGRLGRLIADLLTFSKLEAGQLEFRLEPLNLPEWLEGFSEGVGPGLAQDSIRLELALEPVGMVWADRDRLHQVLTNLSDNAGRFTPPGGRITIAVKDPGEEVRVSVTDTGPGIAPEELPRVFDRFYQGKERPRSAGGAGLGLAIVRSIVEGHGGRVGVRSEPGQGAHFWFTLKKVDSPGPSQAPKERSPLFEPHSLRPF
jgi:signal transduction histidine kinase